MRESATQEEMEDRNEKGQHPPSDSERKGRRKGQDKEMVPSAFLELRKDSRWEAAHGALSRACAIFKETLQESCLGTSQVK